MPRTGRRHDGEPGSHCLRDYRRKALDRMVGRENKDVGVRVVLRKRGRWQVPGQGDVGLEPARGDPPRQLRFRRPRAGDHELGFRSPLPEQVQSVHDVEDALLREQTAHEQQPGGRCSFGGAWLRLTQRHEGIADDLEPRVRGKRAERGELLRREHEDAVRSAQEQPGRQLHGPLSRARHEIGAATVPLQDDRPHAAADHPDEDEIARERTPVV